VVLLGHFGSTHLLGAVLAKKLLGVPYVILVHGTDLYAYLTGFTWADRWVSRAVLRNASAVIANSAATKEAVELRGYPSRLIHIVNPGADTAEFRPSADVRPIRDRLNLAGRHVLLSISRLVRRKGHRNVIMALPAVLRQIPDLLYVIVGTGPEGDALKALVKDMRLEGCVRFAGDVPEDEKLLYYQACDVFIMPALEISQGGMRDYEGFGIVYIEANACGKPVIAGMSGGAQDAVIDGVTGLLVEPRDIGAISQAVTRLLTDREFAARLGNNGRKRAEKELNWGIAGKKVEHILLNYVRPRT
jgi:phosphatidylinositol alpha-1,6-mannosyltransferase